MKTKILSVLCVLAVLVNAWYFYSILKSGKKTK